MMGQSSKEQGPGQVANSPAGLVLWGRGGIPTAARRASYKLGAPTSTIRSITLLGPPPHPFTPSRGDSGLPERVPRASATGLETCTLPACIRLRNGGIPPTLGRKARGPRLPGRISPEAQPLGSPCIHASIPSSSRAQPSPAAALFCSGVPWPARDSRVIIARSAWERERGARAHLRKTDTQAGSRSPAPGG